MSDEKARDILQSLERRERLGDRLVRRVGRRAWERPNVAVSGRIFRLYRLGDPWDPDAGPTDPIPLGPVSLRLGEGRREPAPHAAPQGPPKPKPRGSGLPDVPRAPTSRAPGESRAPPRPQAPRPPAPGPHSELAREFGAPERPKLVGKLPVRPELAAQLAAGGATSGPVPATARQPAPTPPPPAAKPAARGTAADRRSARRDVRPPSSGTEPPPADLPRPPLPQPPVSSRGSARFSLKRAEPVRPVEAALMEPEVVLLDSPLDEGPPAAPVVVEAPARPSPPPEKPVNRSIPTGPGGLDDLFGMAAEAGRMRIGRAKKTTGTGDPE